MQPAQPLLVSSLGLHWLVIIASCLASTAWAAEPIRVELDFNKQVFQLDGTDGASVCQLHGAKPDGSAAAANVAYSTLDGFPDDPSRTEFGSDRSTARGSPVHAKESHELPRLPHSPLS